MHQPKNKKYDLLGIGLSFLCGIHCLITPLLIIYLPKLGKTFQSTWLHTTMIIIMLIAFYQSILKHYKLHKSKLPLSLGITGITFFFNKLF